MVMGKQGNTVLRVGMGVALWLLVSKGILCLEYARVWYCGFR